MTGKKGEGGGEERRSQREVARGEGAERGGAEGRRRRALYSFLFIYFFSFSLPFFFFFSFLNPFSGGGRKGDISLQKGGRNHP